MAKVIILEGPDGGGKTTLANELVKTYGYIYRHEGPPPPKVDLVAHYLQILNESIDSPYNVVHDRLWLGERIYGTISRGVDRVGDEGQVLFERIHAAKRIPHIVCLPSFQVAIRNYTEKIKEKEDYLKSVDTWKKVYNSYKEWISKNSSYFTQEFSYDYGDSPALVEKLSSYHYEQRLPKGMVGYYTAKYLFIGDQPNHRYIDIPFHALNGSSEYLNRAIKLASIKESDIAMSNAYGPRGREFHDLKEMVESLPHLEKIFLLGNEAVNWLGSGPNADVSTKCKVYSLPHPSYLKRFRGNNPQILADAIRKVIEWRT